MRVSWVAILTFIGSTLCAAHDQHEGTHAAQIGRCESQIVSPNNWRQQPNQIWNFKLRDRITGGQLSYFGALHGRPTGDPQYSEIEREFSEIRPEVVFYEGEEQLGLTLTPLQAESRGEPAFVQALAAKAGVEVKTLEPEHAEAIRSLVEEFGPRQVEFFLILRFVAQQRSFWHVTAKPELARKTNAFIKMEVDSAARAGVDFPMHDLEKFATALGSYWPGVGWDQADINWFSPFLPKLPHEDPVYRIHQMNLHETTFRNVVMYRKLGEEILSGRRVFAVVGRNHVPLQSPALACLAQSQVDEVHHEEADAI